MIPKISVAVGRLEVYLWSGSWTWPPKKSDFGHCRNFRIGQIAVEWGYIGAEEVTPPKLSLVTEPEGMPVTW